MQKQDLNPINNILIEFCKTQSKMPKIKEKMTKQVYFGIGLDRMNRVL